MSRLGPLTTAFLLLLVAGLPGFTGFAQQSRFDILNAAVIQLYREGRYAQAVPIAAEAVQVANETFSRDDPRVAVALNNLAALYMELGRYREAEPAYQRSLAIREKVRGEDDPDVAQSLNNLAELYREEGKYADAEAMFGRALRIEEKNPGPESPEVATTLNNLAVLFTHQGRYGEAERLLGRAIGIDEKALGADHPDVARDANNLAGLYDAEGRHAQAEPLFERTLRIDESALGPDHPSVATALNNLALLYNDEGRYAAAETLYRRALRIAESALGADHPLVAMTLENLGDVCREVGREAEAESLYRRSLSIREKVLGPEHPDVATAMMHLARVEWEEGRNGEAEVQLRRAITISEKALGPEHPDTAVAVGDLAQVYDSVGRYAEAAPLFRRSFNNLFVQFQSSFTWMTEEERLEFLGTVSPRFPAWFSFVHRYRKEDPRLIGRMYDVLLWEKGMVATSVAGMRRQIEGSGDPQAIELLNQLAAKRTQMAALLAVNPPDRERWREEMGELRGEAGVLEGKLIARSTAYAERDRLSRATWQQVRDALAPHEAAVEFVRFRYFDRKWTDRVYYVALVVTRATRDHPDYIVLGDGQQIEGAMLTRYRQAVQTRGVGIAGEDMPGQEAYGLIWRPLEKALAGKTRVYLSPDGLLSEVPFGILPTPDSELLMERVDVRLLSSTKDILRSAPPMAAPTALLVGDPAFDLSEEQQRAAQQELRLPQPASQDAIGPPLENTISRDAGSQTELPRLSGTGAELEAISALMESHGWKAAVYRRELALKTIVEQVKAPRVVHLATHGFFLPDEKMQTDRQGGAAPGEDPMLRSGLYFAGADRTLAGQPASEGLDNGVLTAMEAAGLNLTGTRLVVLSACNTGRGDVQNGEGVFGLRRALEEAGAEAVLMSLWSVPDRETQDLMRRFYAKWLGGTEVHEALREAQLEVRAEVRREHDGRDLPYYWGGFVLVGR